jgi:aspartyl-tRNA(Asn)/glutamyl-tRNA(Gln) amidotransferase subunit B
MKIGLETHVLLPTKTKLFCSDAVAVEQPNSSVCPVCMGLPGSKPVLNKEAVAIAVKISASLNCRINNKISFVRKVYFYPDLPKNFQITQLEEPVGEKGFVQIRGKKIRIRRIQIEEDPASIIREKDYTLVDFNRSGAPLVEIVTEPDIGNEEELRDFYTELNSLLYYVGVDIEKEVKSDLNLSVAEERVEVKNVTGINNLLGAARYEAARQTAVIKSGESVRLETRSYDEKSRTTKVSREKETEEEYGFLYETDLTNYDTDWALVQPVRPASLIAQEWAGEYNVPENRIREAIMFNKEALSLLDHGRNLYGFGEMLAVIRLLKQADIMNVTSEGFGRLVSAVKNGASPDKTTLEKYLRGVEIPDAGTVDESEILSEIKKVLEKDKSIKEKYKKNPNIVNFVVGEVSKGKNVDRKALAKLVKKEIEDLL